MIAGLLIIIIFPFIYFYTQMDNFNQKTDVIKEQLMKRKKYILIHSQVKCTGQKMVRW